MRWVFLLCLPLLAADDWTIVPGARVGPITASTTRADLARFFPGEAIADDQIELDEGMLQEATLVYRKIPSQTLAISWKDGRAQQIFICFGRRRGPCRWETQIGIRVGARLSDLERMNGKPFTIAGFGWDYGGNVLSWEGGRLANLDCGARLVLTLDGDRARGGDYMIALTADERHSISGDRPISSSVAAFHKLNPGVVGMLFQFGAAKCQIEPLLH